MKQISAIYSTYLGMIIPKKKSGTEKFHLIKYIYHDHSNIRVQMHDSVMQSSVLVRQSHGEDPKTNRFWNHNCFFLFFLK